MKSLSSADLSPIDKSRGEGIIPQCVKIIHDEIFQVIIFYYMPSAENEQAHLSIYEGLVEKLGIGGSELISTGGT